jgi:hypothetical protein
MPATTNNSEAENNNKMGKRIEIYFSFPLNFAKFHINFSLKSLNEQP